MLYNDVAEELILKDITKREILFFFDNEELKDRYQSYFDFCQTNLLEQGQELGIEPARVYYGRGYTINARAGQVGGYYIIHLNEGLIPILYNIYVEANKVFERDAFSNYLSIETDNFSIEEIMFQSCTIFTFYHERAHLIQKRVDAKMFDEIYLDEEETPEYSLFHHAHEFDADVESSHFCAMHWVDYWKRLPDEKRTIENLKKIISVGLASLMCYFLIMMGRHKTLYFKELHHPHPIMRISYLLESIIGNTNANLPEGFVLSPDGVLKDAVVLGEAFYLQQGENKVQEFGEVFIQNGEAIEDFINDLIQELHRFPNLIYNSH